jgi:hypothetical protein
LERKQHDELARLREQHVRPTAVTLREFMESWLRRKENEGLSPATLAGDRQVHMARPGRLPAAGVPVAAKMMGHSVNLFCETYADLEATREAAEKAGRFLAGQEERAASEPRVVPLRGRPRRAPS